MKKIIAIVTAVLLVCSVVIPIAVSTIANAGTSLTNLYNENYYNTYGSSGYNFTFDKTNKTISTTDTQQRALLNYSYDMTTFESSFKVKSNKNNGFLQAGVAFHVQDTDVTVSQFNPQNGYLIFVRRRAATLNKLELVVRYLKNGSQEHTEVIDTYTGFSTEIDAVLKLDIKVNESDFNATVYDEGGNKLLDSGVLLINDHEINFTSGAYVLTCNGTYTFSDFSIKSFGNMANIPAEEGTSSSSDASSDASSDVSSGGNAELPVNVLSEKYDLYNPNYFNTGSDSFTTASEVSRAILKNGSKDNFSADLTIKLDNSGETKAGIVFRVTKVGAGSDNMQGYAAIVDTTKDDYIRLFLYKYGPATTTTNKYLGRIGDYIIKKDMVLTAGKDIVLHINVVNDMFEGYIYDKGNPAVKSETLSVSLKTATDNEKNKPDDYPTSNVYYSTGKIGLYLAKDSIADAVSFTVKNSEAIEGGNGDDEDSTNPLEQKFELYKATSFSTDANGFTTASAISRAILKEGSKDNFSANLIIKLNADAEAKAGIVFRVGNVGSGSDNMQGYAAIVDTTKDDFIRLYLYKYGPATEEKNIYLGRLGDFILEKGIEAKADKEIVLHVNVVGEDFEGYIYDKNAPQITSERLLVSLNSATDNERNNPKKYPTEKDYYKSGKIGVYLATDMMADLMNLSIGDSEEIKNDNGSEDQSGAVGMAAVDNQIGHAVRGESSTVTNITNSNIPKPTVEELEKYAANFDNYTYYSSSTTNKFLRTDEGITSTTAGAKRAILDGVTVKGFHATATMKISSEGTLRSGIVFRLNNIEKGLDENGALPSNNLEGYAAILYKTPGTAESYARVVLCIYKYGVKNGKHQYLGTVASKASEIPLQGYDETIAAAAGQELTIDVNVIDDQLTAYFYNAKNPDLKSETLVTSLNAETDLEKSTPSLKGIEYKSGAIGLTATDYATFTSFTVSEPIYPSNDVGSLALLDSYTVYGSGVKQEGEYITSNSSGTKKLLVNNLTVDDFTASVDMTIDPNGNLKSGFFFRVNEVGNGADDQTGWAIVVTRNFSTNGETNPNRIDIVLFKWGYANGQLSYLGEVAREVYKSGNSFVDGKMAGEELTFVVRVKGASIDASLYHKANPTNKPVTYSTNLKFAGGKEKGELAYFESGSIGLYLGNSVSDPVNYNKVRNFHIDDGSGVSVKNNVKNSRVAKLLSAVPATGEGRAITVVAIIFVVALGASVGLYVYNKREKREYRR